MMNTQLKKLHALLSAEQAYEREAFRKLLHETPLNQRVKQGNALYPIQFKALETGLGGRSIVLLEVPEHTDTGQFHPGQTVSLFSQSQDPAPQATGVLQRVRHGELELYLSDEEAPEWLEDGKLGLDLYYDEKTYREMFFALQKVEQAKSGALLRLREVLQGEREAKFMPGVAEPERPGLNPAQRAAIQKVLAAEDLALIHGPPGTGKTTTVVAAIDEVLKHEAQVLVCAPSNTAVDLLVRRCAELGHRVVRLGHPARLQADVWPHTLDYQVEHHPQAQVLQQMRKDIAQLRRSAGRFKRKFGAEERAERRAQYAEARSLQQQLREQENQVVEGIFDDARVIACTLVGTSHRLVRKRHFRTVFLDEAGQALEAGAWIPVCRAERIVMAGDHHQLPPTVHNPAASELGISLFEKAHQRQPESAQLLNLQYRMHELIMRFPSQYFYDAQLQAHPSVATHVMAPESDDAELNQALLWIDTAGCGFEEEQDAESLSYRNPEEGQMLLDWLLQYGQALPAEARISVGVIAPYRQQVHWLREHQPQWPEQLQVEIETVDSFQGQERDLICLSLVRSNDRGEIGFLQDIRRTNVAMTRARKKLVMIGDSATLAHHRFYQALLEYTQAESSWRSAWEFMSF